MQTPSSRLPIRMRHLNEPSEPSLNALSEVPTYSYSLYYVPTICTGRRSGKDTGNAKGVLSLNVPEQVYEQVCLAPVPFPQAPLVPGLTPAQMVSLPTPVIVPVYTVVLIVTLHTAPAVTHADATRPTGPSSANAPIVPASNAIATADNSLLFLLFLNFILLVFVIC